MKLSTRRKWGCCSINEMLLEERLRNEIKSAMKSGDSFSLGILRMLAAALQNKAIENRGKGLKEELTDGEAQAVLQKEMKKRQDAMQLYTQGGRADLAGKEEKEAAFIAQYLPAQMSREEMEKIIEHIMSEKNFANFGEAMKAVMAELKGGADAKTASDIIKRHFS